MKDNIFETRSWKLVFNFFANFFYRGEKAPSSLVKGEKTSQMEILLGVFDRIDDTDLKLENLTCFIEIDIFINFIKKGRL